MKLQTTPANSSTISGEASIFLDLLRLVSAMTVLVCHIGIVLTQRPNQEQRIIIHDPHVIDNLYKASHSAVIVFFALSGFVISYTTINKRRDVWQYAQARLSRLYSVLIPALLLSAAIECFLSVVAPDILGENTRGPTLLRFLLAGTYLNEIWFFSAAPPIDRPLWSLSYEFWYYVIFGLWLYRGRSRISIALPLVACLIAGPKILALFPIWLIGCVACRLPRLPLSPRTAWLTIFLIAILTIVEISVVPLSPSMGQPPLFMSSSFATDYLAGLLIGAALWLLPSADVFAPSAATISKFRKYGDLTFSIYLLHLPLIILFSGLFHQTTIGDLVATGLAVTVLATLLGFYLEKNRVFWNDFFAVFIKNLRLLTDRLRTH